MVDCLAMPGEIYAVYLPHGKKAAVLLDPGRYAAAWFNPSTGERVPLSDAFGPRWTSPQSPDNNDWALLLQKK
jgi:hypothetical protein